MNAVNFLPEATQNRLAPGMSDNDLYCFLYAIFRAESPQGA
jgi:hypothetical protein